jgi:anti-sigma factor RsiW
MSKCRWTRQIEKWFDGEEAGKSGDIEKHLASCPHCTSYLRSLRTLRERVRLVSRREEIQDAQFPAFMHGIRERLEAPPRRSAGMWAAVSLVTASIIVASATLLIMTGGPQSVKATVVESYSTDLEGATVDTYSTEDGTAVVWVNVTGKDIQ